MDGPTLITQPPGYPEERPETDDMDGMLEHLADELEGKQLLEKPRVSKKVMQFSWGNHTWCTCHMTRCMQPCNQPCPPFSIAIL